MTPKFIRKYMRMARFLAEDQPVCYSRHVGCVIVKGNKVVGTGYNGPPPGTPHADSPDYLEHYVWPQLTYDEKQSLGRGLLTTEEIIQGTTDEKQLEKIKYKFVEAYRNQGKCPRRIIGAKSGERPNLCSCGHAEINAIINAACDLQGTELFLWCGGPCLQCTHAIIMAGISFVHCLEEEVYHPQAAWLLEKAGVVLFPHSIKMIQSLN